MRCKKIYFFFGLVMLFVVSTSFAQDVVNPLKIDTKASVTSVSSATPTAKEMEKEEARLARKRMRLDNMKIDTQILQENKKREALEKGGTFINGQFMSSTRPTGNYGMTPKQGGARKDGDPVVKSISGIEGSYSAVLLFHDGTRVPVEKNSKLANGKRITQINQHGVWLNSKLLRFAKIVTSVSEEVGDGALH